MKCDDCGHDNGIAYFNQKDRDFIAKGALPGESFYKALVRFCNEFERLQGLMKRGAADNHEEKVYWQYYTILKNIDLAEDLKKK